MHASEYLPLFLAECREELHTLNLAVIRLADSPRDRETIDAAFRVSHSLKSNAATMGFRSIERLTHAMEDVLEVLRERGGGVEQSAVDCLLDCLDALADAVDALETHGAERLEPDPLIDRLRRLVRSNDAAAAPSPSPVAGTEDRPGHGPEGGEGEARGSGSPATVRVEADRLDQLAHAVDELVGRQARAAALTDREGASAELQAAIRDLGETSTALGALVAEIRMVPAGIAFGRLPRLVRDLSSRLDASAQLSLAGEETELDRSALEPLGDLLSHLVRNSLAHGIEPADERRAVGKPGVGRIEVSACQTGGEIVIAVRDDGRGIDPARVARSAAARGLIEPDGLAGVDLGRAIELAFEPGVTTAEQTTEVSGRGVGLDAVASLARALGGSVAVTSEPGRWTAVEIRLPLPGAVARGLLVEARGLPFVIPLDRIERTVRIDAHTVREVASQRLLVLGEGAVPIVDLADELGLGTGTPAYAVLVATAAGSIALAVDSVVGERGLVSRALPRDRTPSAALAGGAVLPSGATAGVVDCDTLSARALARSHRASTAA
jgi:two-component system chemotaxis sensor kinase CheA